MFGAFALIMFVVAVVLAEGDLDRRRMPREHDDTAIPVDPGPIALADIRRVSIVGAAGSGKTTLAEAWQDFHGLPYVKVDALQAAETGGRATPEEFGRRMAEAASRDSWILDGNVDISGVYQRGRRDVVTRRPRDLARSPAPRPDAAPPGTHRGARAPSQRDEQGYAATLA